MVPIPPTMRLLMWIAIGVSVPEGLAMVLGPDSWFIAIWGPPLHPMSAHFIGGIYLSVAFGFGLARWRREQDWERVRIPFTMVCLFALIATLRAIVTIATDPNRGTPGEFVHLDRPFTHVWSFLYGASAVGGMHDHLVYPRAHGATAF